jgi:hypothetical protein
MKKRRAVVTTAMSIRFPQNVESIFIAWGHAVVQFVGALRYQPEGHGLDSRCCHFSLTVSFSPHFIPEVDSTSSRNEYQE